MMSIIQIVKHELELIGAGWSQTASSLRLHFVL